MLQKTMLYIAGLAHNIWGILVDTIEVDEHEVEDYLAQGWYGHPFEVRDAAIAEARAAEAARKPAGPTELEQLRTQLAENERLLQEALAKLTQAPAVAVQGAQTLIPADGADSTTNPNGGASSTTAGPAEQTPEEIELELRIKLAEEAKKKGVKIDGRWGSDKIQAALDKAASGAQ